MSTRITVTSSSDALLASARQVQQANRDAQLQRERDARATVTASAQLATSTVSLPVGGNPNTDIDRRPAAQRSGTLSPFAISWKGIFSGGHDSTVVTLLDTYEVFGSGTQYDIITTQYTGGRLLSPSPVRIASSKALTSSAELPRYEPWRSDVVTCRTTSDSDGGAACSYSLNNSFPGRWLTAARAKLFTPWIPVSQQPALNSTVGPTGFQPTTAILTVAPNGTVFLVFDLPDQPQSLTVMTFSQYQAAGYPENTIVTEDDVDLDYSYAYDPFYGQTARIQLKKVRRYIFIKSLNGSLESKVVNRPDGQELKDFLYANAYADDPSREVRQAGYLGEYRVNGTKAKFLQLKTATGYTSFPFGFLSAYKQESTDLPVLTDGDTFEDHTHTITPAISAAQLKIQLESLANANAPAAPPLSKRKLQAAPDLFVRAKTQLGSDAGDELTPYLFLAVAL